MIGKTLNYISHHAIAILALVCSLLALAGASYAAIAMPKNSVGTAQLKQGAVTPPKFSREAVRRLRADVRGCRRSEQAAVLVAAGEARRTGATFGGRWFSRGNDLLEADRRSEALRGVRNTARTVSSHTKRRRDRGSEPARHHRHPCLRHVDGAAGIAVEVVC